MPEFDPSAERGLLNAPRCSPLRKAYEPVILAGGLGIREAISVALLLLRGCVNYYIGEVFVSVVFSRMCDEFLI